MTYQERMYIGCVKPFLLVYYFQQPFQALPLDIYHWPDSNSLVCINCTFRYNIFEFSHSSSPRLYIHTHLIMFIDHEVSPSIMCDI